VRVKRVAVGGTRRRRGGTVSHALLPDVRTYEYIPVFYQANTLGESVEGEALYARHCPCQVLEVTGGVGAATA